MLWLQVLAICNHLAVTILSIALVPQVDLVNFFIRIFILYFQLVLPAGLPKLELNVLYPDICQDRCSAHFDDQSFSVDIGVQ